MEKRNRGNAGKLETRENTSRIQSIRTFYRRISINLYFYRDSKRLLSLSFFFFNKSICVPFRRIFMEIIFQQFHRLCSSQVKFC